MSPSADTTYKCSSSCPFRESKQRHKIKSKQLNILSDLREKCKKLNENLSDTFRKTQIHHNTVYIMCKYVISNAVVVFPFPQCIDTLYNIIV